MFGSTCSPRLHVWPLQTLEKLAVTVDRDGLVTSLSEPLTGLLAIGLPGGPTPIPREAPHGELFFSLVEAAFDM